MSKLLSFLKMDSNNFKRSIKNSVTIRMKLTRYTSEDIIKFIDLNFRSFEKQEHLFDCYLKISQDNNASEILEDAIQTISEIIAGIAELSYRYGLSQDIKKSEINNSVGDIVKERK